jgi:hypothetical protein
MGRSVQILALIGATLGLQGWGAAQADPAPLAERMATIEALAASDSGDAGTVDALGAAALDDPAREVRSRAIEALGELGGAAAGRALVRCVESLPAEEATAAVVALTDAEGVAVATTEVLVRIFGPATATDALDAPASKVLADLLRTYGAAVVELQGVGPRERMPIVAGSRSSDADVRDAAAVALESAMSGFALAGWPPAAGVLVEGLERDGIDTRELHYRQAVLALSSGSDPGAALRPARRLAREAVGAEGFDELSWGFRGHLVAGMAHLAVRAFDRVEPELARADALLRELRARRLELREPLDADDTTADPRTAAELIRLQALVDWVRLLNELGDGLDPASERAGQLGTRIHVYLLESERLQILFDAWRSSRSFDSVLQRAEGPRRVLLANPELPAWPTTELIALYRRGLSVLASVAPEEFPGIDPAVADGSRSWERDPARRALVRSLRQAELILVARKQQIDRANRRLWMLTESRLYERLAEDDQTEGRTAYLDYRNPSLAALDLSRDLRSDGDSAAALEVAERLRADLDAAELSPAGVNIEENAALAAREAGSALTDLDRPLEAESNLLDALGRLESIDNTLVERLDEARNGRIGAMVLSRQDPALIASLEAQRDRNRALRADVLTALAVNANVRMRDGERALAYFERAYELQSTTFSRVLLACYRARAGRGDEARFLLADIAPTRDLYYNLACTNALLGETDAALEFLRLELESSRLSDGARKRQQEWAAVDPDLASLRGDERFKTLVTPR